MAFAITPCDRREWPRCPCCSTTQRIVEALRYVAHAHRCTVCGARLQVRRTSPNTWNVTVAEVTRADIQPCEAVEPGMAKTAEAHTQ